MFVDFALAYALLNFVASLAVARYLNRTRSTPERETSQASYASQEKGEGLMSMDDRRFILLGKDFLLTLVSSRKPLR